jgi:hypothetical protein
MRKRPVPSWFSMSNAGSAPGTTYDQPRTGIVAGSRRILAARGGKDEEGSRRMCRSFMRPTLSYHLATIPRIPMPGRFMFRDVRSTTESLGAAAPAPGEAFASCDVVNRPSLRPLRAPWWRSLLRSVSPGGEVMSGPAVTSE